MPSSHSTGGGGSPGSSLADGLGAGAGAEEEVQAATRRSAKAKGTLMAAARPHDACHAWKSVDSVVKGSSRKGVDGVAVRTIAVSRDGRARFLSPSEPNESNVGRPRE